VIGVVCSHRVQLQGIERRDARMCR
jgi:hypothetical protein